MEGGLYHKAVYFANNFVYPFADEVVAAHTPAMEDIAEHYSVRPEKLHVIHHPLIDPHIIIAAEPETNHPFIRARSNGYKLLLAVGRIGARKSL